LLEPDQNTLSSTEKKVLLGAEEDAMNHEINIPDVKSDSLISGLAEQLMKVLPFSEMDIKDVNYFIESCSEQYYAPKEIILSPGFSAPDFLYFVRQGSVVGERREGNEEYRFELDPGEMFSVGSVLTGRPVSTYYRALGDCFLLLFPVSKVPELGSRSPVFIDYLKNSFRLVLQKSQETLRQHFAAKAAEAQLHQNTLGSLCRRTPVSVTPDTPLRQALEMMDEMRVGSILVIEASGQLSGILTRYDLLKRVVLSEIDLNVPISDVMTKNLKTLNEDDTVEAAASLMMHAAIRHIPILKNNAVVGLISERDLFTFQRFSVGNIGAEIRAAHSLDGLVLASAHIRQYARNLLSQGVTGHRLTGLVSYLNDALTDQLIKITAPKHNIDINQFCWLALGSEGREEQTIATDQDNALVLPDDTTDAAMQQYLTFAREVNEGLDACGYPLCKGNVMASNPDYCRRQRDWIKHCANWIDAGSPQDLLDSSIFFDFRPISGNAALAEPMQKFVTQAAENTPRFIALLATNAMKWKVPLNMFGGIDTDKIGGVPAIDVKLNGTALITDFARIYALAKGITERNTKTRLEEVAKALGYDENKAADWVATFEFLQTLRLKAQIDDDALGGNPNAVAMSTLSKVDKVILKAALNVMQTMQQRLRLDYVR
jgi:CBS domain-containing protein